MLHSSIENIDQARCITQIAVGYFREMEYYLSMFHLRFDSPLQYRNECEQLCFEKHRSIDYTEIIIEKKLIWPNRVGYDNLKPKSRV